ncbi:hypothetical protein C6501_01085 [Candidatus Poribacteria bacterium]|nr:MAG: hypothetical protein C6501_01085 [Candidatus Poribacteria bacterium]
MKSLIRRFWRVMERFWGNTKRFGRSVRSFWRENKAGAALFLLTVVVAVYTYIVINSQAVQTWKQDIEDISTFIPVAGVIVGALIGGVDFIMFLSDWYSERQQKRIEEAEAEGIVKGAAKYYAAVKNWNDRRIEAESKGEDFDEPMPTPQNVQEATPVEKTTYDHSADDTIAD